MDEDVSGSDETARNEARETYLYSRTPVDDLEPMAEDGYEANLAKVRGELLDVACGLRMFAATRGDWFQWLRQLDRWSCSDDVVRTFCLWIYHRRKLSTAVSRDWWPLVEALDETVRSEYAHDLDAQESALDELPADPEAVETALAGDLGKTLEGFLNHYFTL